MKTLMKKPQSQERVADSLAILESIRLPHGLYLASPSEDYNYVWLRDSVYEVMPYLHEDSSHYEETYYAFLDIFKKYEWKISIHTQQRPTEPFQYIHARYDARTLDELNTPWGHAQHDAVGAVLFGIGQGYKAGKKMFRDESDYRIVQKLVDYLACCRYWEDPDNGMWEEWREIHSSSVGACVAGIEAVEVIPGLDIPFDLSLKGRVVLDELFPRESASRPADLAQLSLIYPYNLLFRDEAKELMRRVETLLLRQRGVCRYLGDSYYSTIEDERNQPMTHYYGTEAEWTFGLPWLSLCHIQYGSLEKAAEYLERTEACMLEDGSLPELYYAGTDKYNGNTPLGWSNALYVLAKRAYEKATAAE